MCSFYLQKHDRDTSFLNQQSISRGLPTQMHQRLNLPVKNPSKIVPPLDSSDGNAQFASANAKISNQPVVGDAVSRPRYNLTSVGRHDQLNCHSSVASVSLQVAQIPFLRILLGEDVQVAACKDGKPGCMAVLPLAT